MIWLLDTNVLIHAQRGHPASVAIRLAGESPEDVAISSVTVAELWYGAAKSPDPARKKKAWGRFLAAFTVLPFDRAAAELHGELRHAMRQQPIGERDLLIACIALAQDLTLVTSDIREIGRVTGLRIEDWSG